MKDNNIKRYTDVNSIKEELEKSKNFLTNINGQL